MEFELIPTQRLLLRKVTPEIYNYMFSNQSDEEIKRFFGLQTQQELEKERFKFEKGMIGYNRSFVLFQLIDKESNIVMGACGFHNWFAEHRRSEIGYALHSDSFMKQGFMSEAIMPIIDYGFLTMGLNRMEAFVGPANDASLSLVRKMKFTEEGRLREHYFNNGHIGDSLIFRLLRSEYERERPIL